jgi:Uma2 family endonuclease
MATVTRLLTYEDWLAMPPAGEGREEVVNGELQVLPPNSVTPALIVQRILARISGQIDENRVIVFGSSVNLLISVALYRRENMGAGADDVLCPAPDLVIEILSPSETKRRKECKLQHYATIGVPEVWYVSPEAASLEIRLLRERDYTVDRLVGDGIISPTRFPDVKIAVAEIWQD